MRRYELVYFCSEHIENAEASRGARVCLLVHDINPELHNLADGSKVQPRPDAAASNR
jgi:hypothetical protein